MTILCEVVFYDLILFSIVESKGDNMLKEIENYKDYYVNELGEIYSSKSGELKGIKPWTDSQGKYLMVQLKNEIDNKFHKLLVHRIVAQAFLPNYNHLPQINHLDCNTKNNNVDNLEWCTAKENIHYSYRTMSQIRNYVTCDLYKDNVFLGHFQSILDAAKYANEHYGASLSGIVRNYKSKGITLIKS